MYLEMILNKKAFIFSIDALILGILGYFIFFDHWLRYIFVHVGALGVIGLFAYFTGVIADKKGLNYKRAFLAAFLSPIFLGIIADYIIDPPRENGMPSSCGGIVSLGVMLIVLVIYLIINGREKDITEKQFIRRVGNNSEKRNII